MNARRSARSWWLVAALLVAVAGCDGSTSPEVVGAVLLSPADLEMIVGSEQQLVATVTSSTGSLVSGRPVSWSSADPDVVSVSAQGVARALSPGLATVTAESGGKTATAVISVRPGDCSEATAGTIAVGESRTGTVGPSGCALFYEGRAEGWDLELSTAATLQIQVISEDLQPDVLVTDRSMQPVMWSISHGSGTARAFGEMGPGRYIVWVFVHQSQAEGSVELSVAEAHLCGADDAVDVVGPDTTFSGTLEPGDCVLPHGLPAVGFRLDVPESIDLRIDLTSPDFDALLVVTDHRMDVRWWDDDGGDGLNARIEQRIPAGEHLVWVTSWDGVGTFELSIQEVEIEPCPVRGALSLGEGVSGTLTSESCRASDGRYQDVWTVEVPAQTTLQIDLQSNQFDAFLMLEDGDGNWLATDDDGGVGLNSRLIHAVAAGEYRIVVTTYAPGQSGSYSLAAQALSGAPAGAPGDDLPRFFPTRKTREGYVAGGSTASVAPATRTWDLTGGAEPGGGAPRAPPPHLTASIAAGSRG